MLHATRTTRHPRGSVTALATCVALALGGCSFTGSAGDASPTTPPASPTSQAAPGVVVAGLKWPDGSPVVAAPVDLTTATEFPGAETIGAFPVYGGTMDVPMALGPNGIVIVGRAERKELALGGNDSVLVWDGTLGVERSSVAVVGRGGRQATEAITDGTTLVWSERSGDQGPGIDWLLFAAAVDGSGPVRLLARSTDVLPDEGYGDAYGSGGGATAGEITLVGDRVYLASVFPAADGEFTTAIVSVSLKGGDLRHELSGAALPVSGADGLVVTRIAANGPEAGTAWSPTGIDLWVPGSDPRSLVTIDPTRAGVGDVARTVSAAGDHVVLTNEIEIVILDPARRTARRVTPPAGQGFRGECVCEDRVVWTTSTVAPDDDAQDEGADEDEGAAPAADQTWFVLTPSTGEVHRLTMPATTGGSLCGGDAVLWVDGPDDPSADSAKVVRLPR